jgi:hypothetical protein
MSGLDLGAAVNGAADWLCSAPIIRSVANNPMFTALLVTALGAIIMMALYHNQMKGAGLKRGARAFVYVFLVVTAVLFVHHYAVTRCARQDAAQKAVRDVFSSIQQSRVSGMPGMISVMPGEEVSHAATPAVPAAPTSRVTGGDVYRAVSHSGYRPDNIALDTGLDITDVTLPAVIAK